MTVREKMSKKLNKHITALNYVDKILLNLSRRSSGVSFCSFTSVKDILFGIVKASDSLVLLISCENTFKINGKKII